jgi:protein subunit release factor A
MINKEDLKIEVVRGTGPGGQNKNKRETACRITHIPTGIQAYSQDQRTKESNMKSAMKELERRIQAAKDEAKAEIKKKRRDKAIHETKTIRTYDYTRGIVKDHRTGKTGTIKEVVQKGNIDKLR